LNWIDSIVPWKVPKQSRWFDYLRILLGLFIVYKGAIFTLNSQEWIDYLNILFDDNVYNTGDVLIRSNAKLQGISNKINMILAIFITVYVITAHLIGGILLSLGLYTRWICLIQMPILLGAIFLVNFPGGFTSMLDYVEFISAAIVLVGLVYFFITGAGAFSIDEMRRRDILRTQVRSANL